MDPPSNINKSIHCKTNGRKKQHKIKKMMYNIQQYCILSTEYITLAHCVPNPTMEGFGIPMTGIGADRCGYFPISLSFPFRIFLLLWMLFLFCLPWKSIGTVLCFKNTNDDVTVKKYQAKKRVLMDWKKRDAFVFLIHPCHHFAYL